jgi:hypothetical protein
MLIGFYSSRRKLFQYNADSGGAETQGGASPAPSSKTETASDPSAATSPPATTDKPPTFSQAELETARKNAADVAATSAVSSLLKDIGLKDVETLRSAIAELTSLKAQETERENAAKTDLEKAQQAAQTAEQSANAARELAKRTLIESKIELVAMTEKARNPQHVAALIDRSGIVVDLDKMTVSGVEAAIRALKASDATSYLFGPVSETSSEVPAEKPTAPQVPQSPAADGKKPAGETDDQKAFKRQSERATYVSF